LHFNGFRLPFQGGDPGWPGAGRVFGLSRAAMNGIDTRRARASTIRRLSAISPQLQHREGTDEGQQDLIAAGKQSESGAMVGV
jgi:hypothetical protein